MEAAKTLLQQGIGKDFIVPTAFVPPTNESKESKREQGERAQPERTCRRPRPHT